jgi:hypothetical protein
MREIEEGFGAGEGCEGAAGAREEKRSRLFHRHAETPRCTTGSGLVATHAGDGKRRDLVDLCTRELEGPTRATAAGLGSTALSGARNGVAARRDLHGRRDLLNLHQTRESSHSPKIQWGGLRRHHSSVG